MSKPTYKLLYFNGRGLGEVARYIFAYAGVPYEDVRHEWDDWEKNHKKNFEWGQLPVLELSDGQRLSQSCAILRYLGKKHGLVATDDLQAARCDEYVDCLWDLIRGDWRKFVTEKDPQTRAKYREELLSTHFPNFLGKINGFMKKHGGKWLVGNQLTWGDFFYANLLELFEDYTRADILTPYPELRALQANVRQLPGIKEWRQMRPVEKVEFDDEKSEK